MKLLSTFVALAVLTGTGIKVPAQAKEAPPPGSAPKGFNPPAITTYALSNGVSVTLVPQGRIPKVNVQVVVRAGYINDGDHPQISSLTAGMLREGSNGRGATEIARDVATMGGDLGIDVDQDQTVVGMDVLSENAPSAITTIAAVLQRPTFSEGAFERVQQNQSRAISVGAARPRTIADDSFLRAMYPGHPYGRALLPDPKAFAGLTLADVKAFYAANFGGQRTHIYVVGQFEPAAVRRAIASSFESWRRGEAASNLPPAMPRDPAVTLIDRPGAVQSTIRFGKRVPPIGQSLDLEAANTLLGGYFASRITLNIRETRGYTYSPYSDVTANHGAAHWVENADITSEATGPALVEIIKEIGKLADAPPSPDELRAVKNYMNGAFVMRLANRQGIASMLAFVDLHGLGANYLENYVARVEALTPQAVQNAVQRNLPVDAMTLVVVGDLASVRPQLEVVPALKDRLPPVAK